MLLDLNTAILSYDPLMNAFIHKSLRLVLMKSVAFREY
uniref:Uncharacterized protein n=1 Tax=Arundo donax TaxID=35708 RepID=A0A0A9DVM5_ARUDO